MNTHIESHDVDTLRFHVEQRRRAQELREQARRLLAEADIREGGCNLFVDEYLTKKYDLPPGTHIHDDGSLEYPEVTGDTPA